MSRPGRYTLQPNPPSWDYDPDFSDPDDAADDPSRWREFGDPELHPDDDPDRYRMDGEPVPYERFHSGFSFTAVRQMLRQEQEALLQQTGERMFVTRSTVLGRWMEMKQKAYADYLDLFD